MDSHLKQHEKKSRTSFAWMLGYKEKNVSENPSVRVNGVQFKRKKNYGTHHIHIGFY